MSEIKTYTIADLDEVQRLHRLWLNQKQDGQQADLSSANLSYANLRSAKLRSAKLRSAKLRSADLRSADLSSADLSYADLSSADLRSANLSSANLSYANLSSAKIAWSSHSLLFEILRRGAGGQIEKLMVAGLLLAADHFCWADFLKLEHPQKEWALAELRKWLQPDETHPFLRPTLEVKS